MSADQFHERKLPAVMREGYEVFNDYGHWVKISLVVAQTYSQMGFKVRTVYTDPETGAVEYQEGDAE